MSALGLSNLNPLRIDGEKMGAVVRILVKAEEDQKAAEAKRLEEINRNKAAEEEQRQLQAALETRSFLEQQEQQHLSEGGGLLQQLGVTVEEKDYLVALIRQQKGVDVTDEQLFTLLSTPMGKDMVRDS